MGVVAGRGRARHRGRRMAGQQPVAAACRGPALGPSRRGGHCAAGHAQHAGRAADGDRQRRRARSRRRQSCSGRVRPTSRRSRPIPVMRRRMERWRTRWRSLPPWRPDQPKALLPVADAYARRAIELDPNHPLGWSAIAQAHAQWTRNWVGAEAGYRRALALDPERHPPPATWRCCSRASTARPRLWNKAARRCNSTSSRRRCRPRPASFTP